MFSGRKTEAYLLSDVVGHASIGEYAQTPVYDPVIFTAQELHEDVEAVGPLDELLAARRLALKLVEVSGDAALVTRAEISRQR